MNDTDTDSLRTHPIFKELNAEEFVTLGTYLDMRDIQSGDTLFLEGDKGDFVSFVIEGSLNIEKKQITGSSTIVATLSSGHSIGEMSIIDAFPRSATVTASASSRLAVLSKGDFEKILSEQSRIGIKMLKGMARGISMNLRRASNVVADNTLPLS